jgi:heme O synthase-like polyprenyltransferase
LEEYWGGNSLKRRNRAIYFVALSTYIIYFLLRIIYEVSKIKVISIVTSILSLVVGIALFITALIIFFHNQNKKESIKLFVISIILILVNAIEYFSK